MTLHMTAPLEIQLPAPRKGLTAQIQSPDDPDQALIVKFGNKIVSESKGPNTIMRFKVDGSLNWVQNHNPHTL